MWSKWCPDATFDSFFDQGREGALIRCSGRNVGFGPQSGRPQNFPAMKTSILIAILAAALVAHAGDQTPVVVPVHGGGTATASKFGDGYITRTSSGQTYTTSQFGSDPGERPGGWQRDHPACEEVTGICLTNPHRYQKR